MMKLEKAIDLAIRNIMKEGLTDIFERPYEVDLLNKNIDFIKDISKKVDARISGNSLESLCVHPIEHVLFPKKAPFDFRRAALMHPMDTITYLALVLQIADEIEKKRPMPKKNYVFSYRFKPRSGVLFDPQYNYTAFNAHVRRVVKSTRVKILVKCDIASFYDRLNLHRLESTLLGLSIDAKKVRLINELLLFWANRDSYGIPTGGNASRILAEAFLLPIDEYLLSHKINFCRFVDDYRFFAPNVEVAHQWLSLFIDRLFFEGLAINPSKTGLEDKSIKTEEDVVQKEPPPNRTGVQRLLVGYTGIVPTKFREISEAETILLLKKDLNELLRGLEGSSIMRPEDIRLLIRILVVRKMYPKLAEVAVKIVKKFPQFTPLIVDVITKKKDALSNTSKRSLRDFFVRLIKKEPPEYVLISIITLLKTPDYEKKEVLMDMLRRLRKDSGAFIGRCLIDALYGLVTRSEALEIRRWFNRADLWERRAIIRLVRNSLPEEEFRPWLKNVKIHIAADPFATEMIAHKR